MFAQPGDGFIHFVAKGFIKMNAPKDQKDIPPDYLDDEILGRMVKEADAMYQLELRMLKGRLN